MKQELKNELIALRRNLHRHAELSGLEALTSKIIIDFLQQFQSDEIITNIGGEGLAAVFQGDLPGKTVMLRAELDALPIPETRESEYKSLNPRVSHKCGHDGHMTILAGIAAWLSQNRPRQGKIILLFQPSEENGSGAQEVLRDPKFTSLKPDYIFALHNLPGFEQGEIILKEGVFASASKGLIMELQGFESHAAEAERGRSPARAMAELIQQFSDPVNYDEEYKAGARVTVIHARLGEIAFGTSPGYAVVMSTLRAITNELMVRLSARCEALAIEAARAQKMEMSSRWTEEFPATVNHNEAVSIIESAAEKNGLKIRRLENPFLWSEDFGYFTEKIPGALFGIGAGLATPALHHPQYDFPEDIIEPGIEMFEIIIKRFQN